MRKKWTYCTSYKNNILYILSLYIFTKIKQLYLYHNQLLKSIEKFTLKSVIFCITALLIDLI